MIIGTDLKRSASNLKPTVFATAIILLWNVSVLSMRAKAWDHRYWFEKVSFESETNGFCNNHFLIVERLNVVHDSQSLGSSVLIWRGLLQIWNQRFLQQPFSYGETSQCCSWHPKPRIIRTDLKRSASNLKPTVYATTIFWLWNVSALSWAAKAWYPRYWFEEVCFESETNGFCNNHFLILKRLSVVQDCQKPAIIGTDLKRSASNLKSKISATTIFLLWNVSVFSWQPRLGASVLIWRGLLRIWNKLYLQQPSSYGDKSRCFPWKTQPMIICNDLKWSASNMKATVSASTFFLLWYISMLSMTTNT